MMERWKQCSVLDTGKTANQAVMFVRQLWNMLVLARVITVGALLRDESRGSHYKPEFPERDDEKFLKTTMASYDAAPTTGPKITLRGRRHLAGQAGASATTPAGSAGGRQPQPGATETPSVKTVQLKIKRQDVAGAPPRWEEFEVPWEEHLNVHAALMEIQRNPVTARRQEDHAGGVGRQLPRRGVRLLHHDHQRPGAAGLLGAGRQAGAADRAASR